MYNEGQIPAPVGVDPSIDSGHLGADKSTDPEVKEAEKRQLNIVEDVKQNFLRALEQAKVGTSRESVVNFYRPELDLLTLPNNWAEMGSDEKSSLLNNKIAEYRNMVEFRRRQQHVSDQLLPYSISGEIDNSLGLTDSNKMPQIARVIFGLQKIIDQRLNPCHINVYNSTGLENNAPKMVHTNLIHWQDKAFGTMFGIDFEKGATQEDGLDSKGNPITKTTTWPSSIPGLTLEYRIRQEGDTAHETRVASLDYQYPETENQS